MFGLSQARLIYGGITLLAVAAFIAWAFNERRLHHKWHERYVSETGEVTVAIRNAVGNPKLQWKDVGQQVQMYASGHEALVTATNGANAKIAELGAEGERLKQLSANAKAKADIEIAKRGKLIDHLKERAMSPGERDDCQTQIAAVQKALDELYRSGV